MEAQRQRVQQMIPHGGGYESHRRRPGGGTGMGLPLVGGLAGGVLLGQAFDNNCGGGFGGGDSGGF